MLRWIRYYIWDGGLWNKPGAPPRRLRVEEARDRATGATRRYWVPFSPTFPAVSCFRGSGGSPIGSVSYCVGAGLVCFASIMGQCGSEEPTPY